MVRGRTPLLRYDETGASGGLVEGFHSLCRKAGGFPMNLYVFFGVLACAVAGAAFAFFVTWLEKRK
jgi:hypothetical protein